MNAKNYSSLPKPLKTYSNVVKSMVPFQQIPVVGKKIADLVGARPLAKGKQLPETTYTVNALTIDAEHLKKYNHVCGFRNNGILPPTYLCVLAQTLQMNMMTQEAFPFALLGLVHINNQVTQHKPIGASETIELSCRFGELKPHDKGQQFDFITTAKVAGEVAYEALTTYLVRGKSSGSKSAKTEKQPKPSPAENNIHAIWQVPENIGRNYAKISGDFNLIHIHAVTAKAFGFPTAIAHGMWSKARTLAEMGDLPESFTVDVSFKLPILLPAKVELIADKPAKAQNFTLYDAKSDKPHLVGKITTL